MRQQQVASSEGAPVSVARKVTVKNGRRESDPVGEEKLGDCLKLGNRRVLVKIPGNRLKVTTTATTTTPQGKCSTDPHPPKAPEDSHIADQDEETVVEPAPQKRPSSDAVSLPQWGQRKRLRFNNRGDVKATVEDSVAASPIPRTGRGSVKAVEKSPVPTVRIKRPAVVPKPPPSPELATTADNNKRNVEAAPNGNHVVNGAVESEPNTATTTARVAEVHSERPVEKVSVTPADSPAALPAVGARTEDNVHPLDRTDKVDMDLFQWPKFIVSLSRKDKEDDFFAIKGTKLPVRPKKRSKHLEKAVTFISPGAWLCDITRERYEVKEKKTIKKRPRGLKAMGSADSDTD